MSDTKDYKKELMDAAHNERITLALSRAITSYRNNVNNTLQKFPHTIKLAEEVREIKSRSLDEMESWLKSPVRLSNRIKVKPISLKPVKKR
jgi:L-lactate dehydrogenase complex protein LldG